MTCSPLLLSRRQSKRRPLSNAAPAPGHALRPAARIGGETAARRDISNPYCQLEASKRSLRTPRSRRLTAFLLLSLSPPHTHLPPSHQHKLAHHGVTQLIHTAAAVATPGHGAHHRPQSWPSTYPGPDTRARPGSRRGVDVSTPDLVEQLSACADARADTKCAGNARRSYPASCLALCRWLNRRRRCDRSVSHTCMSSEHTYVWCGLLITCI